MNIARQIRPTDEASNAGGARDAQRAQSPIRKAVDLAALPKDDFERDVWSILGIPVDRETIASAVAKIAAASRSSTRLAFVTPNVNMLCAARRDAAARQNILDHDLSFADGAPLVLIGRLLGAGLPERVAGSDVFEALKAQPAVRGRRLKVFFFGGRVGSAEAAAQALNLTPSGVESVGALNPGFGDLDAMSRDEIIDAINAAGPDFVVVALGAAKGNAWIARNAHRLDAPIVSHLGAVVDFTAGAVSRAPRLVRKSGFEWAWRIAADRSLWRRYAGDGARLARIFLGSVLPLIALRGPRMGPSGAQWRRVEGVIDLSGDLIDGGLDPVRDAFRESLAGGRNVVLDFAKAGRIDAAFLGQVLMLEKNLGRINRRVMVAGLSGTQRRILALHGLSYAETSLETGDEQAPSTIADRAQSA